MYPFFAGSVPTHSEIKLANAYFYDKAMCTLAWKLFLPEEEFSLDHPTANPLVPDRGPPLKLMPPTLTVVAEHDWMRDRAIAYSKQLLKANDIQTTRIQAKSTVQISEGLEVIIENTPTCIAYDLTRSVNQILNDYISLPEGQAPTTPLPAKTKLPGLKQKDGPRKENDTERKDQGTAYNGQGHTTPIPHIDNSEQRIEKGVANPKTSNYKAHFLSQMLKYLINRFFKQPLCQH